jgi:hypothetical protein
VSPDGAADAMSAGWPGIVADGMVSFVCLLTRELVTHLAPTHRFEEEVDLDRIHEWCSF